MGKPDTDIANKVHLIISVLIVVPVAFIYGFQPELIFDIQLQTVDEHNLFRAIMLLYLGFSILWILGIYNASYLKIALITNIVFMLGLGLGRLLSIILDGTPSSIYVFGTLAELSLGFYGVWVMRKY